MLLQQSSRNYNRSRYSNQMGGSTLKHFVIFFSLALYILGRICDDMNWYPFHGIASNDLEAIGVAGIVTSAVLIAIVKLMEKDGWKVIFFKSQIKFVIPWALTILECVLAFQIFGCHSDGTPLEGQDMDHKGCTVYCAVLLITNLCYSLCCNERTEFAYLIVFEMVLFAEVIYSGILLITFIDNMKDKPKDYSILFISIMIAWLILVMDLLFRAVYEDKHKEERHEKLQEMVRVHHETCEKHELEIVKYEGQKI